jgi:hypothetical protein
MTCSHLDVNDKLTKSHRADRFTTRPQRSQRVGNAPETDSARSRMGRDRCLSAIAFTPTTVFANDLATAGPRDPWFAKPPQVANPLDVRRLRLCNGLTAREDARPSRRCRAPTRSCCADPYFFSGPGVAAAVNVLLNSASKSSDRFA